MGCGQPFQWIGLCTKLPIYIYICIYTHGFDGLITIIYKRVSINGDIPKWMVYKGKSF